MSTENSVDGFTAKILLEACINSRETGISSNELADLYKTCKIDDGPLSKDVEETVLAMVGKRCKVLYTSYTGIVHGLNRSRYGIYNGTRYPVLVKVDETCDGNKDVIFEYELEQVELI